MPRPQKKGLDYFSFDVDFFEDTKVRMLRASYGNDGIVLYIYLLTQIYRGNGYYIELTDDVLDLAAADVGISTNLTRQIVSYLVSRSLLTSILADPVTVITSASIQRRYQLAVYERGKKNAVAVEKAFWLLEQDETSFFIKVRNKKILPGKNEVIPGKNPNNSREKSIKERKVKESKVNTHMPAEAVKRERIPYLEIVKRFNEICSDLPKVTQITDSRKRAISARVKDAGNVEKLFDVFKMVADSDFLSGRSGGWKASFDWIMKPNNFAKIIEGNYQNRSGKSAAASKNQFQTGMWRNESNDDFAEIERRQQEMLFNGGKG